MERVVAAIGTDFDYGTGAVCGEVLWQESCLLGYVLFAVYVCASKVGALNVKNSKKRTKHEQDLTGSSKSEVNAVQGTAW